MKIWIFPAVLSLLVLLSANTHASSACASANPSSTNDVFECLATATINQYNNANPFTNTERLSCAQLKMTYAGVLRQYGLKQEALEAKLPSCDVLASALNDLNGNYPYWQDCLAYDGTVNHMVGCLTGVMERSPGGGNKQLLTNCTTAMMAYESLIMSSTHKGLTPALPEAYKKVDCDAYLTRLQSSDEEMSELPCADFSASNINEHAKRCLLSEPRLTQSNAPLNCQFLRQSYQNKLVEVYGKVPEGYRLLACSVLDDIQLSIEAKRLESQQ